MDTRQSSPELQDANNITSGSSSKLEDVPLENVNQHHSLPEIRKAKSNSLKRFFKINKKGDKEGKDEENTSTTGTGTGTGTVSGKRFGMGFLSSSRLSIGKTNKDGAEASKHTLKSSLSNYWNAIFKKNKKNADNNNDNQDSSEPATTEENNDNAERNDYTDFEKEDREMEERHKTLLKQFDDSANTENVNDKAEESVTSPETSEDESSKQEQVSFTPYRHEDHNTY